MQEVYGLCVYDSSISNYVRKATSAGVVTNPNLVRGQVILGSSGDDGMRVSVCLSYEHMSPLKAIVFLLCMPVYYHTPTHIPTIPPQQYFFLPTHSSYHLTFYLPSPTKCPSSRLSTATRVRDVW